MAKGQGKKADQPKVDRLSKQMANCTRQLQHLNQLLNSGKLDEDDVVEVQQSIADQEAKMARLLEQLGQPAPTAP